MRGKSAELATPIDRRTEAPQAAGDAGTRREHTCGGTCLRCVERRRLQVHGQGLEGLALDCLRDSLRGMIRQVQVARAGFGLPFRDYSVVPYVEVQLEHLQLDGKLGPLQVGRP